MEPQFNVMNSCIDLLYAERRAASVKASDASGNLFELRRLTGFTWSQLADLLNVDRRTLNNWVKGAKIRGHDREHLANALRVLRYADRGSIKLNAAALCDLIEPYKHSAFKEIQAGNYDNAKRYLSYGNQRPDSRKITRDSMLCSGELQPMLMHEGADGTELIEPLPEEPAPESRKRPIRYD